jgi:glutaredoxin-related protein
MCTVDDAKPYLIKGWTLTLSFVSTFQAVRARPVVLFMKGTPDSPQCGFSRTVVQILDIQGVPREKLQTYNVLDDPELRSSIKEYSYVVFTDVGTYPRTSG